MRIRVGTSRLVILTRKHAVKIALVFRPLYPAILVIKNLRQGGVKQLREVIFAERNGGRTLSGKIRYLLGCMLPHGLDANRHEYAFYQTHSHLPLAPVLGTYLGGLFLIMPRGEDATPQERQAFRRFVPDTESPVFAHNHLLRFNGNVKVVDYGNPADEPALLGLNVRYPITIAPDI